MTVAKASAAERGCSHPPSRESSPIASKTPSHEASTNRRSPCYILSMNRAGFFAVIGLLLFSATPAPAQGIEEPLFDTFNFRLEGSAVGMKTAIRLDSATLGKGTTLNFEDDLGLDNRKWIPTLSFEWQISKKHRLAARWQDIPRGSTTQILEEIEWGDEIIPIESNVSLDFQVEQIFFDYTYYPWVKEKWAGGFGLGLRWMDLLAVLKVDGIEFEDQLDVAAPLPYVNFEYRRMLGGHWRFKAGLGWFYLSLGDVSGGQWIGRLATEYITNRRWGFGIALNASAINVDWEGIKNPGDENELSAKIDMDLNDVSLYVRIRFGS